MNTDFHTTAAALWKKLQRALRTIGRALLYALTVVGEALYVYHYHLGVFVLRRLRRFGRYLVRVTRRPRRTLRYGWLALVSRPIHRFFRRMRRLVEGFPASYQGMGAAVRKDVRSVFSWIPRGFVRWLRRHKEEFFSLGRFIGPVVAAVALIATIRVWSETEFCLSVSYRGAELGVIENASVYDEGASLARGRVTNEDESFTVDAVPTLTLTVRGGKTPMSATQVCDAILLNSGDAIAESTGLYVDGIFIGAMEDGEALQALLDGIKEANVGGDVDGDTPELDADGQVQDVRVEFVKDVRIEEGLFPISTIMEEETLRNKLTFQTVEEKKYVVQAGDVFSRIALKHDMTSAELRALNPHIENTNRLQIGDELIVRRPQSFLQVKVVTTVLEEDVTIDYKTQTIYNSDMEEGTSKTITKGQEGKKDVVTEIVVLDGFVVERTVVSEEVTKQPVTRVVEVGTKKAATFMWPVPVCHRVYQSYHSGHKAWDISSGGIPVLGKNCLAADSGKVIYAAAGWNGGYGTVIKIQHDNGLITVYAHLHSMKVSVGDRVTRGQVIGLVGNTGRSTGPHLHFEVIRNGVKVNPSTYFKRSDYYY